MIKAAKAIYDFVIYVSGEISKHKYSLYLTIREWSIAMYQNKKKYIVIRKDKIFLAIKYMFRIFFILIFFKIIFVIRREYFGAYGCVICEEIKDKTSNYIHEKIENMDY
jgi:hypothetical protein